LLMGLVRGSEGSQVGTPGRSGVGRDQCQAPTCKNGWLASEKPLERSKPRRSILDDGVRDGLSNDGDKANMNHGVSGCLIPYRKQPIKARPPKSTASQFPTRTKQIICNL